MNIAYQGNFLREGLISNGHNIVDISTATGQNINAALKSSNIPIDLVLLELYGNRVKLDGLAECEHKLAAWCIDSPINEFWLKDACRLFDYVFVDQKASVNDIKKHGLNTTFLPLCAEASYFRNINADKFYDLTFIGTIDKHRTKRANILNLIQKNFKVNIVNNVSFQSAQEILSHSRITLNENFFKGLTLRMFQGMAAGSLLFTEEDAITGNDYFNDGEQLVCYNPDNIIERLNNIISSYESYKNIVECGYNVCKEKHTSHARVQKMLESISIKENINPRSNLNDRRWHELNARYLSILRFGGILDKQIIEEFKYFSMRDASMAAQADIELGNLFARNGNFKLAEKHYISAGSRDNHWQPWLKLALLHIAENNIQAARANVNSAEKILPGEFTCGSKDYNARINDKSAELLFKIAKIYFYNGRIFDIGFHKSYTDIVPDTAYETALLAWNIEPSAAIMDFMLACIEPYGLAGEFLPMLIDAIAKRQIGKSWLLRTAEIAAEYYDTETANILISAFKGRA